MILVAGVANGPITIANELIMSDTLRQKMMRAYGEVNPPSDLMIATAIKVDARKDAEEQATWVQTTLVHVWESI